MFYFKKWLLFFAALTLISTPVGLLADQKQSQAQSGSPQKIHLAKQSNRKISKKIRFKKPVLKKQETIDLRKYYDGSAMPQLGSSKALVINQDSGEVVYAKNSNKRSPIASITKLMTAMVVLDAQQPFEDVIYISDRDVDTIKGTRSRLPVGASLNRGDMLQLALMASENRAAFALASNYPGGRNAFVKAMNVKALSLGLINTRFSEPTGLASANVSTAEDLSKLVLAAYQYPEIRFATTSPSHEVYMGGREKPIHFNNTNSLVRKGEWEIGLSKTGYITEAGRCLVMQTIISGQPMIIVLLDSSGKYTRIGDANRVRKWLEYNSNNVGVARGDTELKKPQLVMSKVIS